MDGNFFWRLSFIGGFLFLAVGAWSLIYGGRVDYLNFSYFLMGIGLLMQSWLARSGKNLKIGQIIYITGCAVLVAQYLFRHGQQ